MIFERTSIYTSFPRKNVHLLDWFPSYWQTFFLGHPAYIIIYSWKLQSKHAKCKVIQLYLFVWNCSCCRIRKLQELDRANRASLDLERLVAREDRLLDTLSRGVEPGTRVTRGPSSSGHSDGDSDHSNDNDSTSNQENLAPGNIEIDISSMESNSEVIITLCVRIWYRNDGIKIKRI